MNKICYFSLQKTNLILLNVLYISTAIAISIKRYISGAFFLTLTPAVSNSYCFYMAFSLSLFSFQYRAITLFCNSSYSILYYYCLIRSRQTIRMQIQFPDSVNFLKFLSRFQSGAGRKNSAAF